MKNLFLSLIVAGLLVLSVTPTLALAQEPIKKPAPKKELTGRQAALEILRITNRISDSNLEGKDEIAELLELLSAKILAKNPSKDGKTWLCSTDTECAKLEAKLK